jgi:hypothetical protein
MALIGRAGRISEELSEARNSALEEGRICAYSFIVGALNMEYLDPLPVIGG